MAANHTSALIQHVRRTVLLQTGPVLTDGQLLGCFFASRDEAAFATLVKRHGPMVWGVCRRLLDHHDAEDAFQATFLVLARKAASIIPREMVANWLYGVAHQTALQARRTAARRRARERQVTTMPDPPGVQHDLWPDLQPLLDRELSRLPDKYRGVLVLCDLEGKTRKEVALQLGCPEGTVAGRLARARAMLAKRLTRQGLAVSGGALAAVLAQKASSACVPTAVVFSTIKAASRLAAGQAAAGIASIKVAALTEGVLKTMLATKRKIATLVLLTVSLVGLSTTVITYQTLASEQGRTTTKTPATEGDELAQDAGRPKADSSENNTVGVKPGVNEPFAGQPAAGGRERERKEESLEERPSNTPKLQALLKERLEAVRKMADRVRQLNKANSASQEEVRQANLRVYRAEFDLCETVKDRVAVLEKIANVYKEEEERMSQLGKQGAASQGFVLEATISRLEAEIALEREKAKMTAPGK
jgi:RNA polymerase sigma factor (sigma-70 family)